MNNWQKPQWMTDHSNTQYKRKICVSTSIFVVEQAKECPLMCELNQMEEDWRKKHMVRKRIKKNLAHTHIRIHSNWSDYINYVFAGNSFDTSTPDVRINSCLSSANAHAYCTLTICPKKEFSSNFVVASNCILHTYVHWANRFCIPAVYKSRKQKHKKQKRKKLNIH